MRSRKSTLRPRACAADGDINLRCRATLRDAKLRERVILVGLFALNGLLGNASQLAFAQDSAELEQPTFQGGATEGVLVYLPDYFAASNPTTCHDMVRRLPGFSVNDGDMLRGFGVSVGNTLINGSRPVAKAEPVSSLLQRIPASRVERIELIRGGAPGIDMGGYSVVANVVLTGEAMTRHALESNTYLFDGGPQIYGGNYDLTSFTGEQEWRFRLGRNPRYTDSTGIGQSVRRTADGSVILDEAFRSYFDTDAFEARLGWSGSVGAGGLEVGVAYRDSDYELSQLLDSDQGNRHFNTLEESRQGDLALRYDRPLANDKWLEARFIQDLKREKRLSGSVENARETRFVAIQDSGESILRSIVRWQPAERLGIETGGELVYNFLDADQSLMVDDTNVELPLADTRVAERRAELTNQMTWRYRDDLVLEAGINLEHSTIRQTGEIGETGETGADRSFFYPKPRLAVIWSTSGDNQFRLRFERELGQLEFADFAASTELSDEEMLGGNIDLRPQQRWISELVWEKRFKGDGVLALTARRDRIVDAIDVIPLGDTLTAIGNIGDGRMYRLAWDVRFPLDSLGLEGAFVRFDGRYDKTRVSDPTTGQSRPLSNVREFESMLQFEHDLPNLPLTWGLTYYPYYRHPVYHPDQFRYFSVRSFAIAWAEYQFSDRTDLRIQLRRWNDFELARDRYADRQTRQIAFTERQSIDPRNYINIRLRMSF